MTLSHRAQLEQIRTFPQLIRFLRDEMSWPIESEDFEDLTFTYTLEELGIDSGSAAGSAEIKRLRPLVMDQPWGIFFVKFEPKRLPVVALRRILSAFVTRRRASANSADRMTWETDDLLFISSYGEDEERQLSFAHFSPSVEGTSLPTLKVLGWDNRDTALHLDAVAETLTQHLGWPAGSVDSEQWRESWRSAFTLRHREVITTSRELSIRLAELARAIRDRINAALVIETDAGPLTKLMTAFREALVHDLNSDGFADMYAQTIAYGLLSARIADPRSKTMDDLGAHMRTNPLLRELMTTFLEAGFKRDGSSALALDFDELGVNEVVQVLDDANMEAVLRDFGDRNPQEDPVIHFYELFLREYDPTEKLKRGVFYTPRPVVSHIVRSVDHVLRTEFGLVDGLADTTTWGEIAGRSNDLKIPDGVQSDEAFVQILDPATGTGTFLVEVIDLVHATLVAKWRAQGHSDVKVADLWNEYVSLHLLTRLYGYELLMAPYAIAHLKIGLKLYETGYRFGSDERARVFLTNALEPAHDSSGRFAFAIPALAHEAQAVSDVKGSHGFTVIMGNPPYSKLSANLSPEARSLVEPYKSIAGQAIRERGALQFEMNLQDDYVKFVRLAESAIRTCGAGVVGMITNSGYITNPTLRGMRWSILQSLPRIDIVDLHGRNGSGERGQVVADENVFDIQQAVAISVLRRHLAPADGQDVRYGSVLGTRDAKYALLATAVSSDLSTETVRPQPQLYKLSPTDLSAEGEFAAMMPLPELLPRNSAGFITSRDALVVGPSSEELAVRLRAFGADQRPEASVYDSYGFRASRRLDLRQAQRVVADDHDLQASIRPCLYRPFDSRWVYYRRELIESYKPIARHLFMPGNLALMATRQVTGGRFEHVFASRAMIEIKACSHDRNTQVFPLFLSSAQNEDDLLLGDARTANFDPGAMSELGGATGLEYQANGEDLSGGTFGPFDVFHYVYAILHSPVYRRRYFECLRSEFPRCPLTPGPTLFRSLTELGERLLFLHLLDSPQIDPLTASYSGPEHPSVGRIGWSDGIVWLDAAATRRGQHAIPGTMGFQGVPEDVWNFRIGGYQVCEKWLKDRKGRALSEDDIAHYQKVVCALSQTLGLMEEVDEVIDRHGGWPAAFIAGAEG